MRLKSNLLLPIMIALAIVTMFAVLQAFTGGGLSWAGLALAALPLPLFVTLISVRKNVARTSANLPGALIMSGVGVAIAGFGHAVDIVTVLAVVSFAALLWYVFAYSSFGGRDSAALNLGATLPDFDLRDAAGHTVSSAQFKSAPALFLFFRGNWCPLCMAQIQEVADQYKRLAAQGVEVVLVSPQPEVETEKLAAKFNVPFHFLIDTDMVAARHLEIFSEGGTPRGLEAMGYDSDTIMPTVLATDETGTIIFLDETDNYRVRPEPETFLAIFENRGVGAAVAA